ncbi:transmembrane protein 127-like [Acanthaster planci]|uniref:Transmembrane protein 127-like n=1 Tax=Acanthaster planci TaxID=133434 RepID=A0A8B7XJ28_ACAPL|nr:transmembrane protein 127-like [Acanthaster planci]
MQPLSSAEPTESSSSTPSASGNSSTNTNTVTSSSSNSNGNTNSSSHRHSSGSGSRSRSSSSRRHRSRSHGHHHRHRSRRRRHNPKRAERNLVAAILGMVVIAVLISSLAEKKWFYLHGGQCSSLNKKNEDLGAYQFLTPGIETDPGYKYCFNFQVVSIMRSVIAFIFLAITASLFAFFLDTLGPMQPSLKVIRRHAVGNIVTVLLCLMMCGFCHWSASLMEDVLNQHKLAEGSKVVVAFGIGYYLIVASGALSVIIAATNLLRPYSSYDETPRERLIEDWDQLLEAELANSSNGPPLINPANLPEPPPYTP